MHLGQETMTVEVLLFASYAEALGPSIKLDVPTGSTVESVLADIRVRAQAAGKALPAASMAINQRYARKGDVISSGDELAVIPPVAGG